MSLITVDRKRCKSDGLCVEECPPRVLELSGEPGIPRLIEGEAGVEELCIRCGHCVAICPHGALEHEASPLAESPKIDRALAISREQMVQHLRARRSIRRYSDESVERVTLEGLIDAARYAPTGHNLQNVEWLVISGDEIRSLAGHVADWMRYVIQNLPALAEEMHLSRTVAAWEAGEDVILRGAPHLIVVHGSKGDRLAQASCSIALATLELAAPSFGLGACWAGYFHGAAANFPPLQQALALPEGHLTFGAMMVGKAKNRFRRLVKRNEPKVAWR